MYQSITKFQLRMKNSQIIPIKEIINLSLKIIKLLIQSFIPEQSRIFSLLQILQLLYPKQLKPKLNPSIHNNSTMIDWQGLLKFSLQYTDGTKKSQFKQMSQQDKKWLEQAMKQYCNSQLQRIKSILQQLNKKQQESTEEIRLNLLEELQQILDSLDKGNTLYKMGGHIILLKIVFFSKFQSNKIVALQIFSSINQNDSFVQTQSINSGALQLVQVILKQQSIKLRQNMMSAISSMIRGQNLEAKRIFIRLNGLQLLSILLNDQKINSKRLQQKIFFLLRDLLYYDSRLNFTYNDLSSFNNTANIVESENKQLNGKKTQKQHSLTYDKNKQVINNQLQENKKFKGCVQKWLKDEKNASVQKLYKIWLKQQQQAQKS